MTTLTEADAKQAALRRLAEVGWGVAHGAEQPLWNRWTRSLYFSQLGWRHEHMRAAWTYCHVSCA